MENYGNNNPKIIFIDTVDIPSAITANQAYLFVLDGNVPHILSLLATQKEPLLFLMPCAFQHPGQVLNSKAEIPFQPNKPLDTSFLAKIRERITQVGNISPALPVEEQIIIKTIQWIYTRDHIYQPIPSTHHHIGYHLPFIELLFKPLEQHLALEALNKATEQGLLETGQLIDRLHLCVNCHASHLHFQERCTQCHSINLESEDLIHHFRCAHIAPESKYKKGEDLVCPKCKKLLRHIGVDYDRPAQVYVCRDCHNHFQDPELTALCISCGFDNRLEELLEQDLFSYILTKRGEIVAHSGHFKSPSHPVPISNKMVEWQMFHFSFQKEIFRSQNATQQSFIGHLLIKTPHTVNKTEESHILHREIAHIISSYLEDIDLCSFDHSFSYWLLLTDISKEILENRKEILLFNIEKLLKDNNIILEEAIHFHFLPITPSLNISKTLKTL